MNNRGFTLVEVLAVIVILAIIGAIAVPSVTNVLSENKKRNCENLRKSIISACQVYVSDNRDTILSGKSCSGSEDISLNSVPISDLDLKNENGVIKNPIDESVVSGNVSVSFNCDSKKFTCTYDLNCNS